MPSETEDRQVTTLKIETKTDNLAHLSTTKNTTNRNRANKLDLLVE